MSKPCDSSAERKPLKLVEPTDFEILEAMSDGKRHTAGHLGILLDRDSTYMSNRLTQLLDYDLVERVKETTMYEITERGKVALDLRSEYSRDARKEFDNLVDEELARREQCNCNDDADADADVEA